MSDDVVMIGHKAGMSAQTVIQALMKNHEKMLKGEFGHTYTTCDIPCPLCSGQLERSLPIMMFSHWSSGHVRCTACNYRDSFMSLLGKSMFTVERLPEGAVPIYYSESDLSPPSYISNESAAVGADSIREAEDARILGELRERWGK